MLLDEVSCGTNVPIGGVSSLMLDRLAVLVEAGNNDRRSLLFLLTARLRSSSKLNATGRWSLPHIESHISYALILSSLAAPGSEWTLLKSEEQVPADQI